MIPQFDIYKKKWAITSDDIIKPGLKAIEEALALVGNPEKTTDCTSCRYERQRLNTYIFRVNCTGAWLKSRQVYVSMHFKCA